MSKEPLMPKEPRPLQYFLDESGVSTVTLQIDNTTLTCDCPSYKRKTACVHVVWVSERVDEKGLYPVQLAKRTPEDEMKAAFGGDMVAYRSLLLKYGRVEVLV